MMSGQDFFDSAPSDVNPPEGYFTIKGDFYDTAPSDMNHDSHFDSAFRHHTVDNTSSNKLPPFLNGVNQAFVNKLNEMHNENR